MATTSTSPSYYFLVLLLLCSCLFLSCITTTNGSNSDMSIISYDEQHKTNLRPRNEVASMFESWILKHGKTYGSDDEKDERFRIFEDNLGYIDEQNALPNRSFKLGLNRFADITNYEYQGTYLQVSINPNRVETVTTTTTTMKRDRYEPKEPDSIDWRDKGAVGPVKDQDSCPRSSWAFSAIASVEAINKIVTGDFISLSEQELIECDTDVNVGCREGAIINAFAFIQENGGIDSEQDYPYTGTDGRCDQDKKNNKVVTIDGFETPFPHDENGLKKAIANQPVSARIQAGSMDFQLYESGVFNGECVEHKYQDVNIVGYDNINGTKFWIVRNSWGEGWGEKGYVRMERGVSSSFGLCDIVLSSSYPIMKAKNRSS